MRKLIIYNSTNEKNLEEINYYVKNFNHIQVNPYIWIIDAEVCVERIRDYLSYEIGISESILIFELTKEWAISNHINVCEWLIDSKCEPDAVLQIGWRIK